MQKLGQNHGGYRGEQIDIRALLGEIEIAAQIYGWISEVFHTQNEFPWLALKHSPPSENQPLKIRIYISAGIHGDEPAGPLAALKLIQQNQWPENAEIILLPCLNPIGFTLNQRENPDKIDLNRDYRNPQAASTRAHIAWLKSQPDFSFYLCLHEDWEANGFYLYEQNPKKQNSPAQKMIAAVSQICPIDHAEIIDGRAAQAGIIQPTLLPAERPTWPEAFYLIANKSRQGYTLEAPSDFELSLRVNALVAAVHVAIGF